MHGSGLACGQCAVSAQTTPTCSNMGTGVSSLKCVSSRAPPNVVSPHLSLRSADTSIHRGAQDAVVKNEPACFSSTPAFGVIDMPTKKASLAEKGQTPLRSNWCLPGTSSSHSCLYVVAPRRSCVAIVRLVVPAPRQTRQRQVALRNLARYYYFNKASARNEVSFRPTFRTPFCVFLRTMRIDFGLHGFALVSSNH